MYRQLIITISLCTLLYLDSSAQLFPSSGTRIDTICSASYSDDGGINGVYSNNIDGGLLLVPQTEGAYVEINFTSLDLEEGKDFLYIYENDEPGSPLKAILSGNDLPPTLSASTPEGTLYLKMETDEQIADTGFTFETKCVFQRELLMPINGTLTINTCSDTIFDPGGNKLYPHNTQGTMVLHPAYPDQYLSIFINQFISQQNFDILDIYDGSDENAPLITSLSGNEAPVKLSATNSEGALTLKFTSNGSDNRAGFELLTSCSDSSILQTELRINSQSIYYRGVENSYISSGDTFSLAYVRKNVGQRDVTDSSKTSFYLSDDNILSPDDLLMGEHYVAELAGLSSDTSWQSFVLPGHLETGNYFVITHINADSVIAEPHYQENTFVSILHCIKLTGNEVPYFGAKTDTTCFGTYTDAGKHINYPNYNDGILTIFPEESSKLINLRFTQLSLENNFDFLEIFDGPDTNSNLLRVLTGTHAPFNQSATLNNESGALTLRFRSDSYGTLQGFEFTVNCSDSTKQFADLSIDSLQLSLDSVAVTRIETNQSIDLFYNILNTGQEPADSSVTTFYLSDDTTLDANDILIAQVQEQVVSANSSAPLQTYIAIPNTISTGEYYIIAYCDSDSSNIELDEGNNFKWLKIDLLNIAENAFPYSGKRIVRTCERTITDAAGDNNYYPGNDALLSILPERENAKVIVTFSEFDLSSDGDMFLVYDGIDENATLIGSYTGSLSDVVITATNIEGALTMKFISNETGENSGFLLDLSCTDPDGLDEWTETLIALYPNPASDLINVKNYSGTNIRLEIMNSLQQIVMSKEITYSKEDIDISKLRQGIYLFKIDTGSQIITRTVQVVH